jgi:hypothetical protein
VLREVATSGVLLFPFFYSRPPLSP